MKKIFLGIVTFTTFFLFTITSFAYELTSKDKNLVNKLTTKAEKIIKNKGEIFREDLITNIKNQSYKYQNNARLKEILISLANNLAIFDIKITQGTEIEVIGDQVKIIGPENLISEINKCKLIFGKAYGYVIDWGDGIYSPDFGTEGVFTNGKCDLTHKYNVPGDYTITMSLYHLGELDEGIVDWKSQAEIKVSSKSKVNSKNIIKNLKLNKNIFNLDDEILLSYDLEIDKKYNLVYQLYGEKGELLFEDNKGNVSHNGSKSYKINLGEKILKKISVGENKFYINVLLKNQNGDTINKKSELFEIKPEYNLDNTNYGSNLKIGLDKKYFNIFYEIYDKTGNIINTGSLDNAYYDIGNGIEKEAEFISYLYQNRTEVINGTAILKSLENKLITGDIYYAIIYVKNSDGTVIEKVIGDKINYVNSYFSGKKLFNNLTFSSYNSKNLVQIAQLTDSLCYNYYIDWGDGIIEKNDFNHTKNKCTLDRKIKIFSHNYQKPGKYKIIFKDNSFDTFKSIDEIIGVYKKEIIIE